MLDVSLEVPLGPFSLGRLLKRDNPDDSRVCAFRDALDRAAFARRIAAFEKYADPHSVFAYPFLKLHEFALEPRQFLFVEQFVEFRLASHRPGHISW